jgi:polyphosphate kinase
VLADAPSVLDAVAERDHLLHLPYQSFQPVLRFLEEAGNDPTVDEIWITLYRVARDSEVVNALLKAAARGKKVTAFLELKARFDEESNLNYGERLAAAGVRTLYSLPGLKVHAKLALVVRRAGSTEPPLLAYLSTGNFNEQTARIYADHGLFTADPRLTTEVRRVFAYLAGEKKNPRFRHLLVAPMELRKRLYQRIAAETSAAEAGKACGMILKMNSLEDRKIIRRLYDASNAGVPIRLIVRGICCAAPGQKGLSENIEARSIVDRFLEHARIFLFHERGRETLYLSSADWMNRNLTYRVEVAFPIYDAELRRELRALLDLQLADNVKARRIDSDNSNEYIRSDGPPVRAQRDFYRYLERRSGRIAAARAADRSADLVTSPGEGTA